MAISFREAEARDLPMILDLLADDDLGRARESAADSGSEYHQAFREIAEDPNNQLIVAVDDEEVIGCCQLSFIPGLSRRGAWRAQIEAVRVSAKRRSAGIGAAMMQHVIDLAHARNCRLVQLTSDKQRHSAHRFYTSLGFSASHDGFKKMI